MDDINFLSGCVLDCAFDIHKHLGPGLYESVYETVLGAEIERFEKSFRADIVVDGRLIVEVKSRERITAVHTKQLLTYLRLLDLRLGLLLNFGAPLMKDGIHRVINSR